jgi:hypothetical protein
MIKHTIPEVGMSGMFNLINYLLQIGQTVKETSRIALKAQRKQSEKTAKA